MSAQDTRQNAGGIVVTGCGRFSPADATTYFFGGISATAPSTSASAINRSYWPCTGTITGASIHIVTSGGVSGTAATSTIYLRHNDTTDYTVSTLIDCSGLPNDYTIEDLSIPIVAGDFTEWKWTTPTWSPTNPTNIILYGWIRIE